MKTLAAFVIGLFLVSLAFGAAVEKTGVLIDNMCGAKVAADAEKLSGHKVSCAMKCKDSGFGVVVDGTHLKFDTAGSEKALALLQNTSTTNNVMVKVAGNLEGDTLTVTSIEEVK
ncbi:MAG: hypothetical protein ACRD1R_01290 [Acidobacteriota bacterium]